MSSSTSYPTLGQITTETATADFPFEPGDVKVKMSAFIASLYQADGEVIIDSGAGRGIKPTMFGLVDPQPSSTRFVDESVAAGTQNMAEPSITAETDLADEVEGGG